MIRVKVVGAGGYGGIGIIELLTQHPEVEIGAMTGLESVGNSISDLYPHLKGFCDNKILADDQVEGDFDVVFMSTPDGVGMKLASAEIDSGAKVIDYSGDFRFNTVEDYAAYATRIGRDPEHASPDLLEKSVYGLVELHREEINQERQIVGNPGCFAASCILGLAPAVKLNLVQDGSIICDCKTGVSGAGKTPNATFHYPARYDQMNAYKLAGHQHVCEIEHELSLQADKDIKVTFTAQVVPVCRGIMSTLYGTLSDDISEAEVLGIYDEFYANDSFIRVFDSIASVGTMHVRGTNYCNLVISVDERTHRLRVVSYIDNLMKGQAGSALQIMNLLFGFSETTGLERPGMYP